MSPFVARARHTPMLSRDKSVTSVAAALIAPAIAKRVSLSHHGVLLLNEMPEFNGLMAPATSGPAWC